VLLLAERALRINRTDMLNALIVLFETPVPEIDQVSREVLTCILGTKPSEFDRQLIDILGNKHLSELSRPGVPPIVWETRERYSAHARTVLNISAHYHHNNST
jgi:hypothetical protein